MVMHEEPATLAERQDDLAAQLRLMLDSTGEGFYGLDCDGRCTFVNRAALDMTGFERHELLGEVIHNIGHHSRADGTPYPIDECEIFSTINTGKGVTVEDDVFWKKDGSSFPVAYSSYPLLEDGETRGAVVVFTDVTERKKMERDLHESDELFRNAFEVSKTGMALIGLDNKYLTVNNALCEMVGYTREELLALDWMRLTHPEDVEAHIDLSTQLLAGAGEPYNLTTRYHHKNGSVIWINVSDAVVRDADGHPLYCVSEIQDITERKATQGALEQGQELLQGVIDNSPAVIYVKKTDGTYLLTGKIWLEALGLGPQDVIGKTDFEVFPLEQAKIFRNNDDQVFRTEKALEVEEEALHPDGSVRIYRSIKFPLFDRRGTCYALCGVSEDITDKKRAEGDRARLEDQLRQGQKMEAVGQLAGGIAHDFNNILAVILNYSAFLAEDLSPDDSRAGDIQEIVKAGEKAALLVHQLLAFSRKEVIEPEVLNLNDVVAGLTGLLTSSMGEAIDLVISEGPGLSPILADAGQMEQVLLNLAVNARDAMPRGGTLWIETSTAVLVEGDRAGLASGLYVRLCMTDTGIGMTSETLDRIFEPFFTTKVRGEGTGLGLATVYGIVKQANGGIYVDSTCEGGTVFSVFIPVTDQLPINLSERAVVPTQITLTGTILVVEDDRSVRELVSRILRKAGYRVIAFASGPEALAYCEKNDEVVDLLVTDVVMPEMSGKALADSILAVRSNIKTVFMSGYTDQIIAERGVLEGGENLILKPFRANQFVAKVRSVLGVGG